MHLINDIRLDIATAPSRRTKQWKNVATPWSEIVNRLSRTVRTPESMAEYKAMSKDQQSEIKDVGGFVGGYCNSGSRTDVRHRSVIALDADFASLSLWDDWLTLYGHAAAVYSTHKHTPEKPRLRLVIPVSRNVSPDEYQAIARRIASDLGIDQFDDTTYQPQRVMYWPSTSQDAEFYFKSVDAEILDPDQVLRTYVDWKDISSWPMSSRVSEVIRKDSAKQADPLEKGGLLGAFCRAYSIEEAIDEFIPVYVKCSEPGRYTFTEGSTAAGVITYDNKFSYSFHATDPASGQLCNAWDLVRLHKFGDLDADADPSKSITSRPSYKAMTDLALEDPKVRSQIFIDRSEYFDEPLEPGDETWISKLKILKDGSYASTIENVVLILTHDPRVSGLLRYDEFSHNIITTGPTPWREEPGPWTDSDDAALRFYLEKAYGLSGKDKIFDAVNVVAMDHKTHTVRDYLNGCSWDGTPRVETLLIDYLGAADSEYTRTVTRKSLVAAVARIYRPGCKFDYMLTLRGRQGLGKSGLIRKLGGQWFSDSFSTIQGKDSFEQLQGVWIMEVGELAGMRKAEAETIKLYISKQVDRFRPAYGRRSQEFPRQCVFFGTTNETMFLRDATGNRRFWIIDTPNDPARSVWTDLTEDVISQIWAEAVLMYRKGEALYLSSEMEAEARRIQTAFEEENPRAGIVLSYLDRLLPTNWEDMDLFSRRQWLESDEQGSVVRQTVTSMEIYAEALIGNPDRLDRYAIKEIHDIMVRFPEWRRMGDLMVSTRLYGRQKYYRRVEE